MNIYTLLLTLSIISVSTISTISADQYAGPEYEGVKLDSLTSELIFYPEASHAIEKGECDQIKISLPDFFSGKIVLNNPAIKNENLQIKLTNIQKHTSAESQTDNDEDKVESENGNREDEFSLELMPEISQDHRTIIFSLNEPLPTGKWELDIPSGYFEIQPSYVEVKELPYSQEELMDLNIAGAWHKQGNTWDGTPMFSIHDDDGVDGKIPSCGTTHIPDRTGYFTMLFPLLQSLGVRGNVSMEGWRCGMTAVPPKINDNGKIMRRLEKEFGWEMQGHSMEVLGDRTNNWMVDSLTSPLAERILREVSGTGFDNATTSVYDAQTAKQYYPSDDRTRWIESPQRFIKPYAYDYNTRQPVMYVSQHDVAFHWGRWFDLARLWGFKAKAWVQHNAITSHEYAREILGFAPYGFSDLVPPEQYNLPPMRSTATRMLVEGQSAPGYIGEMSDDNSYDHKQFRWFCDYIDRCVEDKGWIVLGLHAYRKCWRNYIPGALVSEGGDYPDEWVEPLKGLDYLNDPLDTPPARLGIADWSEWYPCPGSRLEMLRDLILHCLDKGMMNVTSSEGFEIMGNRHAAGYFNNGVRCGYDRNKLVDDREIYPHYVESSTGEEFYYNPLLNKNIKRIFTVSEPDNPYPSSMASGILPTIHISSENGEPIADDRFEINAIFHLNDAVSEKTERNGVDIEGNNIIFKSVDNSPQLQAKRNYDLIFDKKVSLLDLPENKHYVLLSNYGSYQTWLGHELGLELSRNLGMPWTPHMYPVELIMNGVYEGVYFLCESIEIAEGRLEISRQENEETDSDKIPYGWLLEINDADNDNANQICIYEKENGPLLKFSVKTPEIMSDLQYNWIENELIHLNSILYSDSRDDLELNNTFNIDSFVKYFIIREILSDFEGYSGSFHIYRDNEEEPLWCAGPVWNLTMNRILKDAYIPYDTELLCVNPAHWFGQFMKYPSFEEAFKKIWKTFYTDQNMNDLRNHLINYSQHLQPAFDSNNLRWRNESFDCYNNYTLLDTERTIKTITSGLDYNTGWINDHQDLLNQSYIPNDPLTYVKEIKENNGFVYDGKAVICRDEGVEAGTFKLISPEGFIVRYGKENFIDLSGLKPGAYIVTAIINDKTQFMKIIKR